LGIGKRACVRIHQSEFHGVSLLRIVGFRRSRHIHTEARSYGGSVPPCERLQDSSLDTAATRARSRSRTDATSNLRAAAAMRVSAAGSGIGGAVSPFLARWKRTGLMRATT